MKLKILSRFRGSSSPKTMTPVKLPTPPSLERMKLPYDELVAYRREVCLKCEHITESKFLNFETSIAKCGMCGCFIKSKTAIRSSTCPDHRW